MSPRTTDICLFTPPLEFHDYIASEEEGRRPYALLFCLSWFHKTEKKPDPTPQVYDVDLVNAEQEDDPLDAPIPTRNTMH
ncbi:hypothetical protein AZE42_07920 [Rhizopogon vesiculosus]|uniref:Uncharacterized protein n=1 Tax=Rhizopogon vesiculosus TaxID=180088 RepID=A0A1J8QDY0_9AGAM|nr:hypothetical protein AZE42_07920 [Rhizopogon vesiculosus]